MEQQRTEATESLLVRQGNDNLVYNEENGGLGDGGSVAVSDVTTILGLSTFVAACISFGSGCAVGYSSPTESSIMEDLGLSVAEFSVFGSILSIGALLGSAVSGKITDLLGRKLTMWILNLFYIGGWLAIAFTKMPVYISEITTKSVRGRFSVIPSLTFGWGISFMYVVGSFVSWRTLALIATIPGLLQLLPLFFIPESPRWLAKVGRDKELEDVLLCLRGNKADIFNEAAEIKDYVESLKSFSKEGILEIFQKKYVRPLLVRQVIWMKLINFFIFSVQSIDIYRLFSLQTVVGMIILMNLGGANAFAFYSGVIFVSAGLSSMVGLITLAATQTIVGVLGIILIDKLGRRPLQLVSTAGLCFSCFLTGLSFLLKESNWWDQGSPALAFIGLLMYAGSYIVGSGIPWLLLSELFPINVKGSAGSICNFMGSCTGWVVAYYFNFLTEWSSTGTFFIFSVCCAANFILSATMVPETKGRTLEEIQTSITHS
ncbi:sugar transporter ERD6-like 15 isoform X3 [Gossypium arboreum]|uniref:sugar transporter ERD6-like 15 isoform X3 n=1 Tax=Gossypium arboreum TaxID=29729 RepID=UPI0022F1585E|nr:sugar transporter ERD6-like 15 isoform X3 [Gossypium arboreum]